MVSSSVEMNKRLLCYVVEFSFIDIMINLF